MQLVRPVRELQKVSQIRQESLTQFGVSLSQFADLYHGSVNNLLDYEVDHKFVGKNTFCDMNSF